MPDLVLEAHRRRVPIDHPLRSVTRTHLEYPTENVSLGYLISIDKATCLTANDCHGLFISTSDNFVDKAFQSVLFIGGAGGTDHYQKVCVGGRVSVHKVYISYLVGYNTRASTADFGIVKYVDGSRTVLATESVDIPVGTDYLTMISISGSAIKGFRADMSSPKISATDTDIASGKFGGSATSSYDNEPPTGQLILGKLLAPSSTIPPAKIIIETETMYSETEGMEPVLVHELVDITKLDNLPNFLKYEAKRYELLKQKGFSDEEIVLLLGYIPQYQVDLGAVTWGVFDHKSGHSTMLLVVTGDNPYRGGAIEKQVEYAKARGLKVVRPPRDYWEAVEQYRALKKDFPEWIAGKDNYAYQTLGHEVLELFQVADTYYGNIVEGIKPNAYKNVPDWEMRRTLSTWIEKLKKVDVLTEERDKHIRKLEKVLRIGW